MTRSDFGSIQRHGDNWRIWWTAGGKRHSKVIHGTKAEASKALAALQLQVSGIERDMTWTDYWDAVVDPSIDRDGLAVKTAEDYRRVWNHDLRPMIGDMYVSQTTPRIVEQKLSTLAPAVAAHDARVWRKVCNMAVRDGLLQRSPFDFVRIKAPQKKQKELLAAENVGAFLERIRGLKYEPVLLCELGGGLRHEEACALLWEDVSEWEYRGVVYAVLSVSKALVSTNSGKCLKGTKNGFSEREVVIGEPFASRLLSLRADGALLAGADGYANPNTMTHNYRDWCRRHDHQYVQPKNLRSSFATLHGEAGSPDSLVSGAMGHSDGTTKGRNYQQITRRGMALIADNLAAFLEDIRE